MIPMREGSDSGNPIMAADPASEASQAIARIAETIDVELASKRRYNPGLKLLS
jgi:MinD-like ATPase involved in chromosome partitioning or flagellar assembly